MLCNLLKEQYLKPRTMKTLFTTIQEYLNRDFMPVQTEVRFITYQQILEGWKEKVKRLLCFMAQEQNFERVQRAKQVLSRIEQAKFTIS